MGIHDLLGIVSSFLWLSDVEMSHGLPCCSTTPCLAKERKKGNKGQRVISGPPPSVCCFGVDFRWLGYASSPEHASHLLIPSSSKFGTLISFFFLLPFPSPLLPNRQLE